MKITPSGQPIPSGNASEAVVGQKFSDRNAAVQACEEHFSSVKQKLQEMLPSNPMLSQSMLEWLGNGATPNIPLGVIEYPNPAVYEVTYSIRETL